MVAFLIHNIAPIMFLSLIVFLLLGYPVAFSLAALGLFYGWVGIELGLLSPNLLQALPERVYGTMANDTLLAIPFFTFMGLILERSGMAEKLLDTVGKLFGPVRGGVAYAVIFVGALLAATTGVVAASVIAMGLISLPIMLRYGYDRRLASGVIAASGTLAQIIPPSLVLIVLADQLGRSVGDMYLGAFVPGIVLTILYMLYVFVRTLVQPDSAPALPAEARSFGEGAPYEKVMKASLLPLALVIWGMILLFDPEWGISLFERYLPFVPAYVKSAGLQEPWISIVKIGALIGVYALYVAAIRFVPTALGKVVGLVLFALAAFVVYRAAVEIGTGALAVEAATLQGRLGGMALVVLRHWPDILAAVALVLAGLSIMESPSRPVAAAAHRVVADLLPPLILIFLVLGTIFRGIATPTEGGAMGAAGAIVLAVLNRKLDWSLIRQAGESTAKLSAFVLFILVGARVFSLTFYGVNGHIWVEEILKEMPGGMYGFLIIVNALIFFLAFFLDFFELAFIAVPLLVKAAETIFSTDPHAVAIAQDIGLRVIDGKVADVGPFMIWFGVLLGVNMQTSFMHPPFGFALFYLRSVAPTKPYLDTVTKRTMQPVTTGQIYWGAVPFVLIQVVMVAVVLFFPRIVMWYNDTANTVDPTKFEIQLQGPLGGGMPGLPGLPGQDSGLGGPPAGLGGPPAGLGGPPPGLGSPPPGLGGPPPGLGNPPDLGAPPPGLGTPPAEPPKQN
ncbi:TRAP transporter large permease [Prosthecomicrobium sp. N25]|uniref:TRAP transporter large permease n=1 Tax=Prosthecomicrobium sp. N25 TaxID=3129254 RepID=UPI003077D1AE